MAIFDHNGVPVWWLRSPKTPIDAKLLPDGNLTWNHFPAESAPYEVRRLDGSLVRTVDTVGTPSDLRDIEQLPNGNYVLPSYRQRSGVDLTACGGSSDATVQDAEIQEVTPNGELVWSWNSKDHIDLSETTWCPTEDLAHLTSIAIDGQDVVVGMRHMDAVYKIDRKTSKIVWKLGGTPRHRSLRVLNDPVFDSFGLGGPHDVDVLTDATLTIHDNGKTNDNVPNPEPHRPPRAVRYMIDPESRTATLIEEVRDPRVREAFCCGSARKLGRGNWVMQWGANRLVTELTPSGDPVFSLTFADLFSYRADALPFGELSRAQLRRGMDMQHPR